MPTISIAARMQLYDDDNISSVRISLGPAGPVPYLAEPAMELLTGGPAGAQQYDKAAKAVLASVPLRTSKYRATQEYREEMIRMYLPLILERAAERARRLAPTDGNRQPVGRVEDLIELAAVGLETRHVPGRPLAAKAAEADPEPVRRGGGRDRDRRTTFATRCTSDQKRQPNHARQHGRILEGESG